VSGINVSGSEAVKVLRPSLTAAWPAGRLCRLRRQTFQLVFCCFLALGMAFASTCARAATANTATTISPADARRAEAENTLKAIADAAPATASPASSVDASAAAASAGAASSTVASSTAAASAAPSANASKAPLEKNGLIAQILRQIDRWSDRIGSQLHQVMQATLGIPALMRHFALTFSDAGGQAFLFKTAATLGAVMAIALALELALNRLLGGARRTLFLHADRARARAEARAARDREQWREQSAQAKSEDQTPADSQADKDATDSGMRPPDDGVALVRSQRDGVDRIDAVMVGPASAAAPLRADGGAHAAPDVRKEEGGRPVQKKHVPPAEHWGRLRLLPFTLGALILDLLPLALFLFSAAMLSHWLGKEDARIVDVVRAFVDAYVSVRVTMAVLRVLIAPAGRGVAMLKVGEEVSTLLYRWLRRIVVIAAFGIGLADAVQALGADATERLAIIKIVSLFVHLFAVILIFRVRQPVGRMIAAPPNRDGLLASLRNWLAHSWAYLAGIFVIGVWVVWAMGVQDGFPKLIRFIGVTTAVIVGARMLTILVSGALSRAFCHAEDADDAAEGKPTRAAPHRLVRYYPIVHGLVSIVIGVCAVVALLQLWGVDVIGWLSGSTIGRSLLSALLTIAVAVFLAVVIWETADAGIKRRLDYWTAQGEVVRAARLRTLVPMMRTSLFVVILLVVGLTVLSQIGINTTPLLAGASIVGVALGFGSQKLVQDFITGIFLLMENAMQVGDWVTVAGVSGTVEYLSIRTVRLRAGDGSLHIVPFSSVSTVNNTNRGLGNAAMRISVSYGADVEQVTDELKQIGADLRNDPAFKDQIFGDIEIWGVDAIDGSTITIAGQIRCSDKGRWGVQRELNRRILERFRSLGIQIADPRTTLLLPGETVPPLTSAAQRVASAQTEPP
jgi:small-conductance mechanosensitive channel